MKVLIVAVCMSVALTAGAPAFGKSADAPFKLTASGDGRVQCTLVNARGNILRSDLKPGKGTEKDYSNAGVDHGTCEYKAASKAPLTIVVEGDAWACPLLLPAGAVCTQTVAAGASGSFRLVQKERS